MPCQDQTETLMLTLDEHDQLQTFYLQKISCGKTVGDETLLPHIQGKSIPDILAGTVADFVPDLHRRRHVEEFLLFKQFFSIRAALLVFTGQSSGQREESFVLEEVCVEPTSTSVRGQIAVPLIHEEIQACGSCRSCSSLPQELQSIANALIQA